MAISMSLIVASKLIKDCVENSDDEEVISFDSGSEQAYCGSDVEEDVLENDATAEINGSIDSSNDSLNNDGKWN